MARAQQRRIRRKRQEKKRKKKPERLYQRGGLRNEGIRRGRREKEKEEKEGALQRRENTYETLAKVRCRSTASTPALWEQKKLPTRVRHFAANPISQCLQFFLHPLPAPYQVLA
jgi:hypothetical protein